MTPARQVLAFESRPPTAKARLRADAQESITRSIEKLPILGLADADAALFVERTIDDLMPAPNGDGLDDDARAPHALAADASPPEVTTPMLGAERRVLKRRLLDVQALARSTTRPDAAKRARVLRLVDQLQISVLAMSEKRARARVAHDFSHEAHERSAAAKAYSAAARRRLARTA